MSTGSEGIKPVSDADLPENSQENLDQKLDHAIEETFPTSDPVSVTITKGGAADPASARTASSTTVPKPLGRDGRNKATELKDRAADAVQSVAETATATVGDAVAEGRRRVRRARERYPEADRYIGAATRSVENPVTMLLVGIGLGYCLAWMIYGRRTRTAEQVPDYARTRQRYAPRE